MKSAKQLWALLKFQAQVNPFIWIMPLAFGVPTLLPLFGDTYHISHPDFFNLVFNPTLFGFAIFGAMILAPDRIFIGNASMLSGYYGTEFILTRAIDRPVFYRAKAVFLYLLVTIIPLVGLVRAMDKPDVVVQEYERPVQQAALAATPGSRLLPPETDHREPSLIAIPRGAILAAEWQMLLPVMLVILLQVAVLLLHPFKYGRWIFWGGYIALSFGPFFDLTAKGKSGLTLSESAFFAFTGHQVEFLGLTALVFIAVQLGCERWFARLEQ